jgi:outer membrane protein TolC
MSIRHFPARAQQAWAQRPRRGVLLLAAAALSLMAGRASGEPLGLEECIALALDRNDGLAASRASEEAAAARLRATHAALWPTAALRGGASYAPLTGYDPALTEGGELAARLAVEQRLYDGGARRTEERRAHVEVQDAAGVRARTAADLRLAVREAYIDLWSAARRARLAAARHDDLDAYLATVRALAHGGAVPKTDILGVEIELDSETLDRRAAEARADQARVQLRALLGLPADAAFAIADSVVLPPLPALFAADSTLEARAASRAREGAELEGMVRRAARRPVLSALGSAGAWTGRAQLVEGDGAHVFGFLAGVELEMPLWDGGATTARVDEASALARARAAEERWVVRQARVAYDSTLAESRSAHDQLTILAGSAQRAADLVALLPARYAGGNASGLEVLTAHRALLEIQMRAEEARADTYRLHAALLRLAAEDL